MRICEWCHGSFDTEEMFFVLDGRAHQMESNGRVSARTRWSRQCVTIEQMVEAVPLDEMTFVPMGESDVSIAE